MPKKFNLDSIPIYLPKEPGEVLDSTLPYFKQFPVDSGKVCVKNGILISDRTAGEYIFYKLGYSRLTKEMQITNYLLSDYYDAAASAEKIYQGKISDLTKSNERTWVEKHGVYLGFVFGIITAVLTEDFVIKATK